LRTGGFTSGLAARFIVSASNAYWQGLPCIAIASAKFGGAAARPGWRSRGRQKGLNFKPGGRVLYSNSGYVLLGVVVERVSGKSLREFEDELIFRPLGMSRSLPYDDRTMVVKDRAAGYAPADGVGWAVG
jgi:CubicO group peptidase (beta-lactamase class C family)